MKVWKKGAVIGGIVGPILGTLIMGWDFGLVTIFGAILGFWIGFIYNYSIGKDGLLSVYKSLTKTFKKKGEAFKVKSWKKGEFQPFHDKFSI